jgi:hypothetical protein
VSAALAWALLAIRLLKQPFSYVKRLELPQLAMTVLSSGDLKKANERLEDVANGLMTLLATFSGAPTGILLGGECVSNRP